MPSCHHSITDTGDAYLGRLEKKEDNYNGVSGVLQLTNYPPKPASREGYFDDKILLRLNEVLDVIQKQASGANPYFVGSSGLSVGMKLLQEDAFAL